LTGLTRLTRLTGLGKAGESEGNDQITKFSQIAKFLLGKRRENFDGINGINEFFLRGKAGECWMGLIRLMGLGKEGQNS
jgi:hypothetical protein